MSNSYTIGKTAEQVAGEYLKKQGYKVINVNWKTKYCEIDIVAELDKVICFVEVKYRKNDSQGKGFDYITDKKLRQMERAAEMWVIDNSWDGEYQLAGIELSGDYVVDNFCEI